MADPSPSLKTILIQKAMENPGFKEQLLADPKGVIERLVGCKLPDALEVAVVQETPGKVVLVLPFQPAAGELSCQELESVAGGGLFDGHWLPAVVISVAGLGLACVFVATIEKC